MYTDAIITEVWKNRDAYVESHQHNLAEMVSDLKKRQEKSGSVVIDRRTSTKEHPVVPAS